MTRGKIIFIDKDNVGYCSCEFNGDMHPDLRLGQLICNIIPEDKLYYVEDDVMQEKIIYWDNK